MGRSKRKKRKRNLPPRAKRMKRSARLQSARCWLPKYAGKNVLKGYCKHFGVDWRCAAIELEQLGVELDPDYLRHREIAEQAKINRRRRHREQQAADVESYETLVTTPYDAWLLGDLELHYALSQEQERLDAGADAMPF